MQPPPDRSVFPRRVVLGAYGLQVTGVEGAEALLVAADASWPMLDVEVRVVDGEAPEERVDEDAAQVRLRTGGWIEIDRVAGRAVFNVPGRLTPDEVVHPFLAPVAAVASHWYGRESLHGGGLALGGRAWGVVGDRLDGKSSLLAALALHGVDIVADDVLVVEGPTAFSGPRTVDLREDAAAALGVGECIGVAGARERWRLRLPPIRASFPLAGWIFASWDDEWALRRVPASEALPQLLRNRAIRIPPRDPGLFLRLSALPAWELRRPKSWQALPETVELLLKRLAG